LRNGKRKMFTTGNLAGRGAIISVEDCGVSKKKKVGMMTKSTKSRLSGEETPRIPKKENPFSSGGKFGKKEKGSEALKSGVDNFFCAKNKNHGGEPTGISRLPQRRVEGGVQKIASAALGFEDKKIYQETDK